jgi:hypothetical protein
MLGRTAGTVDLDCWWSSVPAHHRRALERLAYHPLPHTLARALLVHPQACELLELRGEGDRARYVLTAPVADYVASRAGLLTA